MTSLATARAEWDRFLDQQAALVQRLQVLTMAPYRSTETGPAVCESVLEAVAELLAFAAQGCPPWPPVDESGKLGEPFEAYLEGLTPARSAAFEAWSARCEQVALVAELLGLPEEQVLPVVLLYEARPDLAPRDPRAAAKVGRN